MQFIIIYFSGTGNTQLISQKITDCLADKGHDIEMVSIEDTDKLNKLNFDDKIIGFAYPVYKFTYPDNFNNALPIINKLANNNMYFHFSTYTRFAADALYDFSKHLDKEKFKLIAQTEFKCPSCGISARLPFDDYEYQSVMFFEDDIHKKIDSFVEKILQNQNAEYIVKQTKNPFNNLKKRIVAKIEIIKYPKLEIDRDRCVACGLCARKCPDNNLIKQQDHIDITDNSGCLHCLRCINHCPVNAITFGRLTEGDNQYTFKVRDELYENSSNGYKERYWGDFDKVIAKWRRKTLKYWITHFYRKR